MNLLVHNVVPVRLQPKVRLLVRSVRPVIIRPVQVWAVVMLVRLADIKPQRVRPAAQNVRQVRIILIRLKHLQVLAYLVLPVHIRSVQVREVVQNVV